MSKEAMKLAFPRAPGEPDILVRVAEGGKTVEVIFTKAGETSPTLIWELDRYDLDAAIGGMVLCRDAIDEATKGQVDE